MQSARTEKQTTTRRVPDGPLTVAGVSVADLLDRYGSPLFVFDIECALNRAAAVREHFPAPRYRLFYSMKANPSLAILERFRAYGFGCDACSLGDVELATLAGWQGADISLTGVGFSRDELRAAKDSGVWINVDSLDELEIYLGLFAGQAVGLRLATGVKAGFHAHCQAAEGGKLGIDLDELERARTMATAAGSDIEVLHGHVGSDVPLQALLESAKVLFEVARFIPSIRAVNVGGGIGVPWTASDDAFPVTRYAEGLENLAVRFQRDTGRYLEVQLEPGEFLVAEAGYLATTVRAVKRRDTSNVAIVDATANLLPAALLYDEAQYPVSGRSVDRSQALTWEIYGRTNQGGERLATARRLPELSAGDHLVFGLAGAYASCRSSQFNEIPRPAEVIIDRGTPRLMRVAESHQDLYRLDFGHGVDLDPINATRTGLPPRAREAFVAREHDGGRFSFRSSADDLAVGVDIDLTSTGLHFDDWDEAVIAAAWSVVFAQHVLAENIRILPEIPEVLSRSLQPILQMLYDIRCCCDDRAPVRVPRIPGTSAARDRRPQPKKGTGTLVLLSGGVDSTMLLQSLKAEGGRVEALHARINPYVEKEEEQAARTIAERLGVALTVIDVRWPGFIHLGTVHSRSFGIFPYYNAVPHGRDLLLAAIAGTIASKRGFESVAFAAEEDSFVQKYEYMGTMIHRCDVQAEYGCQLTDRFVSNCISNEVEFVAPFSGVSQYELRRRAIRAIEQYPDLLRVSHSCVWSKDCGRCLKCLAIFLTQIELGKVVKHYSHDLLDDPAMTELQSMITSEGAPREMDHGDLYLSTLRRLVRSNHPARGTYWLRRLEEELFGQPQSKKL